jgi:predicted metalloprotease
LSSVVTGRSRVRWKGRSQSGNVEDRRGMSPRGMVVGGGLGTIVLVLAVALLGGDPRQILDQLSQSVPTQGEPGTATPPTAEEQ